MGKKTILLLEESATMKKIFELSLPQQEYLIVASAFNSLTKRDLKLASICVIDCKSVPEVDDFLSQFGAAIKELQLPVLFLKAVHDHRVNTWEESYDLARTLKKPFDARTLSSVVGDLLVNKEAQSGEPSVFSSDVLEGGKSIFNEQNTPEKLIRDFLQYEAPQILRDAAEEYCRNHFQNIAQQTLQRELRRLAEEKTRVLSQL